MSADRPDGFVLDSGVAIAWFFPETEKERLYAASVLRLIAEGARVYATRQEVCKRLRANDWCSITLDVNNAVGQY